MAFIGCILRQNFLSPKIQPKVYPHLRRNCFCLLFIGLTPDLLGIANPNPKCFQKIQFVDSVCSDNFKKVWWIQQIQWIRQILTNPHESVVHRCTINKPESVRILGFGFSNPNGDQKIYFGIQFGIWLSKDSFWGFNSVYGFQKICFGDWIWKAKILKRFC